MINKLGIPENGVLHNANLLLNMQKLNEIIDVVNSMEKDIKLVLEASIILMNEKIEAEKVMAQFLPPPPPLQASDE